MQAVQPTYKSGAQKENEKKLNKGIK